MNLRRWLTPGIGVKRWLLVLFIGLLLLALAFAHLLRQATRDLAPLRILAGDSGTAETSMALLADQLLDLFREKLSGKRLSF